MISVHDNCVYGCTIDLEAKRITLHTVFDQKTPAEFTDIVFNNVVAHRFEHSLPGSILFDVVQVDACHIVDREASLFSDSWQYGWPPVDYSGNLDDLKRALIARGIQGFELRSSYGLTGWVLCPSSDRAPRNSRARLQP